MRFWVADTTLAQELTPFLPNHVKVKIIDPGITVDDIPLDESIVWSTQIAKAPGLWSLHPRFHWIQAPQEVTTLVQPWHKTENQKQPASRSSSGTLAQKGDDLKKEIKELTIKIQHLDRYQKFAESLTRWDESEDIREWIKPWGAYFELPPIDILACENRNLGRIEAVSGQLMENHPDFPSYRWVMPLGLLKGEELYLASTQALNLREQEAFIHLGYLLIHRVRKVASDWEYDHFHKLWIKVLNASQYPLAIFEEQKTNPLLSNKSFQTIYGQLGPTLLNLEHKSEFLWQNQVHQTQKSQAFIDGKQYTFIFFHNIQQERAQFIHWSHQEKLDLLSKLSARLSHELINPLSGILQVCSYWLEISPPLRSEWKDDLSQIGHATQKTLAILQAFRAFSSSSASRNAQTRKKVEVKSALKRVLTLVKSLIKQMRLNVVTPEQELWIMVQPTLFEQVIINLIMNSAQACHYKGHIHIKVEATASTLFVYVTDDGPGIPPHLQEKVFEPLFTTKTGEQKGTGLGLSFVKSLITQWNGSIKYDETYKHGAQFIISLPLTTPPESLEDQNPKDFTNA
jgi:signal transduction histidine kinase